MPVQRKRYALRKKNGKTRVVQCGENLSGSGYRYKSDRKKCTGKTFRTKTDAKRALSKLNFGRRRKRISKKGKRNCGEKRNEFGAHKARKAGELKKFYTVCPNDEGQLIRCEAIIAEWDGDKKKIARVKKSGEEPVYYLLPENAKLRSEDKKDMVKGDIERYNYLKGVGTPLLTAIPKAEMLQRGLITGKGTFALRKSPGGYRAFFKKGAWDGGESTASSDLPGLFNIRSKLDAADIPGYVGSQHKIMGLGKLADDGFTGINSYGYRPRYGFGYRPRYGFGRPSYLRSRYGFNRNLNYGFSRYF